MNGNLSSAPTLFSDFWRNAPSDYYPSNFPDDLNFAWFDNAKVIADNADSYSDTLDRSETSLP